MAVVVALGVLGSTGGALKRFHLEPESCPAQNPSAPGARLEGIFTSIYKHGNWGPAMSQIVDPHYFYKDPLSRKSASGGGSAVGSATAPSVAPTSGDRSQ